MKILTAVPQDWQGKAAVAIGKFEGMHKGHRKLIGKIMEKQQAGLTPVAFTFDKSPRVYFGSHAEAGMLFMPSERRELFEDWGLPVLIEYPFDKLADMEAGEYVERLLIAGLHVGYLAVGEDFCFGRGRKGDVGMLRDYASRGCFELEVIDKKSIGTGHISSTRIRQELAAGHMEEVNAMLDIPFFVEGEVVGGNHLGKTWGIPTANIYISGDKFLPPNGVYLCRVHMEERMFCGVTNIGHKPTMGEGYAKGAETHLYGFDEDIYGKNIRVELLRFQRAEQKFESIDALVGQLRYDLECGKEYFGIK